MKSGGGFEPSAHRWRVLSDTRAELGEGPLWSSRRGSLFWVDVLQAHLYEWSPGQEETRRYQLGDLVGWIIECRSDDRFIVGLRTGFAELRLNPLQVTPLVSPDPAAKRTRMNDARADARGRIFAGTMAVAADQPIGNFYRLDPDGTLTLLDSGYTVPNGPAFSREGRILYHTDSAKGLIYRFPVRDDGALGQRSVFLEFPADWGKPDGMTVDADDHLWVAHWGGSCVSRFAPTGARVETLALPTPQITSCTFGGADLERLFVTSAAVGRPEDPLAGALFEVEVAVRGVPAQTFGI